MSNPAVMLLASLNEITGFPYRFEVEDNIGEAIHIHYKDIRLDLTIREFYDLANSLENILNCMVPLQNFQVKDFDAGNLVWLAGHLADLEDIVEEELYLEDIRVDTYDEEGKTIYLPLVHSRVLKALHGDTRENNARRQINYFHEKGCERQTNQERLLYDLEQIKKYGYPRGNERILLRKDGSVIDGQHRAACLYFLYGNIKVPVRKLLFKEGSITEEKKDRDRFFEEQYQILRQKQFELEQQYHNLDLALNEKDRIIANYQEEQKKCWQDIRQLDIVINEKDRIIADYQKELAKAAREKEAVTADWQAERGRMEQQAQSMEGQIYELEKVISEIKNSFRWKITHPFGENERR